MPPLAGINSDCPQAFGLSNPAASPAFLRAMALNEECPWAVRDDEVNEWLGQNADSGCLQALAGLPEPDRRSKAWSTMRKHQAGQLTGNPSAYLMAIVRRSAESPYPRPPTWPGGGAVQNRSPGLPPLRMEGGTPSPDTPRGVARQLFVNSPVGQAQPADWALTAWAVRTRPGALFRALRPALGDAMTAMAAMPDDIQKACALFILLHPSTHSNPAKAVHDFANHLRAMPLSVPQVLAHPGAVAAGENLVVAVQLGRASGYELHALNLSLESLNEKGIKTILGEIVACTSSSPCSGVIDDLLGAFRNNHPVHTCALDGAMAVMRSKVAGWSAQQAKAIVMITLPAPSCPPSRTSAPAPSYHGSSSKDMWTMLSIVDLLLAASVSVAVVVMQPPGFATVEDSTFFNTAFGEPIEIPPACTRVPQRPWIARASPCVKCEDGRVAPRPLAGASFEAYDPSLRGAFEDQGSPPSELPSLDDAEEIFDLTYSKEALSDNQKAQLSRISVRAAGGVPGDLLARSDLASLFGVAGLTVNDFFERRLACAGRISLYTGQPVPAGANGAECRRGRWCPPCSYHFDNLVGQAGLYAWVATIKAAMVPICSPTIDSALLERRPVERGNYMLHTCESSCSGGV